MEKQTTNWDWISVGEVELLYRPKIKASERPLITQSKDAYHLLAGGWNFSRPDVPEEFKALLLSQANRVLGLYHFTKGGIADVKLLLAAAIKSNCTAIILCHNNPTGNLIPSETDKELTLKIYEAAKLFDIRLLDHLIVNSQGYMSFADEGLL